MTREDLRRESARHFPANVETYEEGCAFKQGWDAAAHFILSTLQHLPSAALRREINEYFTHPQNNKPQ